MIFLQMLDLFYKKTSKAYLDSANRSICIWEYSGMKVKVRWEYVCMYIAINLFVRYRNVLKVMFFISSLIWKHKERRSVEYRKSQYVRNLKSQPGGLLACNNFFLNFNYNNITLKQQYIHWGNIYNQYIYNNNNNKIFGRGMMLFKQKFI